MPRDEEYENNLSVCSKPTQDDDQNVEFEFEKKVTEPEPSQAHKYSVFKRKDTEIRSKSQGVDTKSINDDTLEKENDDMKTLNESQDNDMKSINGDTMENATNEMKALNATPDGNATREGEGDDDMKLTNDDTINKVKDENDSEVDRKGKETILLRHDSALSTERAQAIARVASEVKTMLHSTSPAKQGEMSEYIIGGGDPLLNTRAKYSFNQYEMPEVLSDKRIEKEVMEHHKIVNRYLPETVNVSIRRFIEHVKNFEKKATRFAAKLVVLLSRSSGRDKVAAFFQYGSLFWGNQPFVNISGIEDGPEAPWRLLEDSMSSGRKVFRLFKWVKEYERARLSLMVPDSYLGCVRTKARAFVTRILAILMHGFAGGYYFVDNIIWAAQIGLINRAAKAEDLKKLFKQKVPYEEYVGFQSQFIQIQHNREIAQDRINRWKDWKNWLSLQRLIFAIIHCLLQLDSLHTEKQRLEVRYAERIAYARALSDTAADRSCSSSDMSLSDDGKLFNNKKPYELEVEKEQRVLDVGVAQLDTKRVLLASVCNLAILLNSLKFESFKKIPLWGIGILGVIAAMCGIHKNWPQKLPKPKVQKHLRSRSDSFEKKRGAGQTPT